MCFPWGAGDLLVCRAVYSITPGNSLTSTAAALLGSGGSQDDKLLLEEIPFPVRGSGSAGHAGPPCKHVHSPVHTHGAHRVPAPGAFPWGTRLGEFGASWPRVLWEESSAGEQSKGPRAGVCGGAGQYSRSHRSAMPGLTGCWSHACVLRPQLSKHSWDVAVAGGWSSPAQGHSSVHPGWGREFAFLVSAVNWRLRCGGDEHTGEGQVWFGSFLPRN